MLFEQLGDEDAKDSTTCGDDAAATGRDDDAAAIGNDDDAAATGRDDNAAATGRIDDATGTGRGDDAVTTGRSNDAAATGCSDEAVTTGRSNDAAATERGDDAVTTGRDDEVYFVLFSLRPSFGVNIEQYYNLQCNLEELLDNCDMALLVASQSSKHCFYSRFAKKDNQLHTMVLRRRGHNFALPIIKAKCAGNTFINHTF